MSSRLRNVIPRFFGWLGGTDPLILLVLLVAVASFWAFFELADEPPGGRLPSLEQAILLALRDPVDLSDAIGPPWFEEAVRDITALGSGAVIGLVTSVVIGFLLFCRMYQATALVLVATVGGQVLSLLLKAWIDRPRPEIVPHLMHASTSSFPSGHSLLAAVVYLTLGTLLTRLVRRRALKLYILFVSVLLTLLVGASRVYLGVHYPSDVLAGWAIGLAWALLCWEAARFLQSRGLVEPAVER